MRPFRFDHTYTFDPVGNLHSSLAARGFTLRGWSVEHPGSLYCEFFSFEAYPPFKDLNRTQYLEFCTVRDMKQFHEHFLKENHREPLKNELLRPGYSFTTESPLEEFYQQTRSRFDKWEPQFVHKNYSWKIDSTSRLPGWNFLTFNKSPIPLLDSWVTEYEPRQDRPADWKPPTQHENTCKNIRGIVLRDDDPEARNNFEALSSLSQDPIYWATKQDVAWKPLLEQVSDKVSPYLGVILSCSDTETFKRLARPDYEVPIPGGSAFGLKQPSYAWDILVVGPEHPFASETSETPS